MSAYFMAQIEWNSPDAREAYVKGLTGMVEKHGGRFIVASSDYQVAEGEWPTGRLVMIEFPTMAALRGWYDSAEDRPLLEMRLKGSRSRALIVDGSPPPAR